MYRKVNKINAKQKKETTEDLRKAEAEIIEYVKVQTIQCLGDIQRLADEMITKGKLDEFKMKRRKWIRAVSQRHLVLEIEGTKLKGMEVDCKKTMNQKIFIQL